MTIIDSSFKFEGGKKVYKTKDAWAKIRIKRDPLKGDYFIDVLMGVRGEQKPHVHFGINGDQSRRFLEPRGVLHTLNRRASDTTGFNDDRTLVLHEEPGKYRFIFKVMIYGPEKKIKVLFDNAELS